METRTLLATLTMLATLAVGAPAAIAAPQPAATASPMSEQALFQRLRALPFFAGMTDEQLRAQPLPPGFKSWQEFLAAHEQLNAPTPKATPRPQPAADAPNLARDRQLIDRAEAGDAAAQAQLGIWSLYGRGTLIPLDERAAFRWQSLAAEQRHLTGVDYMSAFYENGNTAVARDRVEALKWALVLKALQQEARKPTAQTDQRLARIKSEMTPEQIREAASRAKAWLEAHPAPRR